MDAESSAYLAGIPSLPDGLARACDEAHTLPRPLRREADRRIRQLKLLIRLARERYEETHGPIYVEPPPEC